MKLIIISGRSGSGKSVTLNLLEDLGYYCIDNLPLTLLPELVKKLNDDHRKIAVSIDARNLHNELEHFDNVIESLKTKCEQCEIIFLDADDNTLLRRFSETRRKHPLTNKNTNLKEALQTEHKILQPIIERADLCVDTSLLTIRKLRGLIRNRINQQNTSLSLLFQSFGYKFGIPTDTDFIFDARCLPNPFWEKNIRHHTGQEKEISDYLEKFPQVTLMFEMIRDYIEQWLPAFEAENRRYLTISVGCTGGQHRSVYLTEKLKDYFLTKARHASIRHRDLS